MGMTFEKNIEKEGAKKKKRLSYHELELFIERLNERVEYLENSRPPRLGWISQKDFCMMVGRTGKDGKKIPINRSTFHNMVKGSNGAIEIIKINNGVWVTKYPGQPQYDKSEAA